MSTQQTDALQCAADLEYSIPRHRIQDAFILAAYKTLKMVRTQHARIADLEAQLEAIGAGGVSGPLIGQPQAMPDLSQLTERGAKAWAGVDAQGLREGGADMSKERDDLTAFYAWLHTYESEVGALDDGSARVGFIAGRASLQPPGFTAADMATVSAQGFRDGVASLSANAGEPRNAIDRDALIDAIAQGLHGTWHCTRAWEAWHVGTMSQDDFEPVDESETPTEIADAVLALLAAPPAAGQARWQPIETAPKDGQDILVTDGMNCYCVEWDEEFDWWTVDDNKLGPFRLRGSAPTHWMKLPEAPGPADGESNG